MMSGYNWLIVLGGFMVVSMVADRWARSATSLAMQYAGLGPYVVAEAIIFVPILLIAQQLGQAQGENIIATAGVMTAVVFGGLTVAGVRDPRGLLVAGPVPGPGRFRGSGVHRLLACCLTSTWAICLRA